MGGNQSTDQFLDKPLIPQQRFVGNMSQRFVRPREVTLELEDEFWSKKHDHEIEIKDLTSDQVLFRLAPTDQANSAKVMLLDGFKVPVVRMESRPIGPRGAGYSVYPGGPSASTRFCEMKTEMTPFEKPMRIDFVDRVTGAQVRLGITGKWLRRTSMIWIESGQWDARYSIARVYRKPDTPEGKFLMDVASGVDIALMVLIAGAMDEQSKKHEIGKDKKDKKAAKEAAKASKKASKAAAA
ncbi:hypothetical protein Poli38472_011940 [Pythium oligandrum]|uniref:Uncharacterized protein n=1 Tax=Pythium oligandrum TaxID=41045 RepID=A0A8K1FN05_PYTOL|nr:hypothetical protein Poli38472_011940 [Pythium oligandrum]|eukprot:TMW66824.1 hypothetical protein Poli38472_011940 [Pythium oligandrum]